MTQDRSCGDLELRLMTLGNLTLNLPWVPRSMYN